MSCGAFGGSGSCGGGGGAGGMGMGMNCVQPRSFADRRFFDPFCIPMENRKKEPICYFNPFVHAQCLGVDMNMQDFRNDILKCQEDYKKAVWAVLKKYAVGDDEKPQANSDNSNLNNVNNFIKQAINGAGSWNENGSGAIVDQNNMNMANAMEMMGPDMTFFYGNQANSNHSLDNPHFSCRGCGSHGMGSGFNPHLPPI